MIILRFILGFGIGFCLGNFSAIGSRVRRVGVWNEQEAQEAFAWLFMAFIGLVPLLSSFVV